MKIDRTESAERLKNWHPWFAWRPVWVAPHQYCWLEYVERKRVVVAICADGYWDYRAA